MADLGTIKSPVHDHAGELLMSKSATVELIEPSSFGDMIALTGNPNIGDLINTQIIQPLVDSNESLARTDF